MKKLYFFICLLMAAMVSPVCANAVKVYFNNPKNWSDVKAYIYAGDSYQKAWPGSDMTKDDNGYCSIEVAEDYANGNIIFNNGSGEQYPASQQPGLQLSGKDMIAVLNGDNGTFVWSEYHSEPFNIYFRNSMGWAAPRIYYWGMGVESPIWPGVEMTQHDGNIYRISLPAGTAGIIFSNNGESQTGDISVTENHIYNHSGTDSGLYTPTMPSQMVIYGNVGRGENFPGDQYPIYTYKPMTREGNNYVAHEVFFAGKEPSRGYFAFSTAFSTAPAGSSFTSLFNGTCYGALSDGTPINEGEAVPFKKTSASQAQTSNYMWGAPAGNMYDIVVDFMTNTVTITRIPPAEVTLNFSSVDIAAGESGVIEVSFTSESDIYALQFDIEQNENITIGKPVVSDAIVQLGYDASSSVASDTGYRRVLVYGFTTNAISKDTDVLLTLPVTISEDAPVGDFQLQLSGVVVSDNKKLTAITHYEPVNVSIFRRGDVNKDGMIELCDLTTLVNHLNGRDIATFHSDAADANADGIVDNADVESIIDTLMAEEIGVSYILLAPARVTTPEGPETFSSVVDNDMMKVSFTNADAHTATKFDVDIAGGASIISAKAEGSDIKVIARTVPGTETTRVIAYSPTNANFPANGTIDLGLSSNEVVHTTIKNCVINAQHESGNTIDYVASGYSNVPAGIDAIAVDPTACSVYTPSGIQIFNGDADAFRSQAAPGIYLMHSAGKVQKIVVR